MDPMPVALWKLLSPKRIIYGVSRTWKSWDSILMGDICWLALESILRWKTVGVSAMLKINKDVHQYYDEKQLEFQLLLKPNKDVHQV